MWKGPMYVSDLTESDRTQIKNCIAQLQQSLRCADGRLRNYEVEEGDEPHRSTVFKLLQDLKMSGAMIDATVDELVEKHGLPAGLKQTSDDLRQDVRSVLIRERGKEK